MSVIQIRLIGDYCSWVASSRMGFPSSGTKHHCISQASQFIVYHRPADSLYITGKPIHCISQGSRFAVYHRPADWLCITGRLIQCISQGSRFNGQPMSNIFSTVLLLPKRVAYRREGQGVKYLFNSNFLFIMLSWEILKQGEMLLANKQNRKFKLNLFPLGKLAAIY